MKIGIYFPGFPPEAGGGYTFEQDILSALIKLSPQSHHQFTLFFQARHSNTPEFKSPNLQTITLEEENSVSKLSSLTTKITGKIRLRKSPVESTFQKSVRQKNIEFIWFPTSIYSPVEIPYIATVWDIQHRLQPWFPEVSANGQWNFRESYYAAYLHRATYIITPNETGMRELSLFYQLPLDRFRLLPHPVPYIEISSNSEDIPKVLEKYKIPPLYLLYPAQFWSHKNHANLLLAHQILRNQFHIDIDLVLVGSDQGNMQYVQNFAENISLKENVHFLGFIPRNDLIALYRGAFALTYVTFFGPENLPPLEAFSCGCPVIASSVAGSKEQLGEAALQVDGRKPEEIALGVKRLFDDPILRKFLVEKGNERAVTYTNINYVQDVFKMLDEFEPVRRNWQ